MTTTDKLHTYHFTGPGGERTVRATNETDARHLAMVARWGHPDGRPVHDTGPDGRYLSDGLYLVRVD